VSTYDRAWARHASPHHLVAKAVLRPVNMPAVRSVDFRHKFRGRSCRTLDGEGLPVERLVKLQFSIRAYALAVVFVGCLVSLYKIAIWAMRTYHT
jgi:hypothetical protein